MCIAVIPPAGSGSDTLENKGAQTGAVNLFDIADILNKGGGI